MLAKDLNTFHKHIDSFSVESPPVIVVSGSDIDILDSILNRIQKRLSKEIGAFETTLFTGEAGEDMRLEKEAFNVPLFAPYRVLLLKQGELIFKPVLGASQASKGRYKALQEHFRRLPNRTLILISYAGKLPARLESLFGKNLLHLETRALYPNQVLSVVQNVASKLKLEFSPEALHFLAEHAEPKAALIERLLVKLKAMLGDRALRPLTQEDIREVVFPGQGCDSFALVDAFFGRDRKSVKRELIRFNPDSDNYLGILKLMLNRANELRKYQIAQQSGMKDGDLMGLLGHKKKHPFVQKKILSRLGRESSMNPLKKIGDIYGFLIEIEEAMKSGVSAKEQALYFQERSFQAFFRN